MSRPADYKASATCEAVVDKRDPPTRCGEGAVTWANGVGMCLKHDELRRSARLAQRRS